LGVDSYSIIQVYVGSEVVVLCLSFSTLVCTSSTRLFFDSRSTPLPHSSRVSILSTKGPSLVSAKLIGSAANSDRHPLKGLDRQQIGKTLSQELMIKVTIN